jgi:hypothetical protein
VKHFVPTFREKEVNKTNLLNLSDQGGDKSTRNVQTVGTTETPKNTAGQD